MMRCVFLALILAAAACSGSDDEPCEPIYQGDATDEAWRTMLDARGRVMVGSIEAVAFTAPTEGQTMAAADLPPLVAWSSPLAKPHLPPVTGDVYLVEIAVPGRECPVNLLTTDLDWRLDAQSWAAITAGGAKTVEVTVTSAYLVDGRITEGPFQPTAPRTFNIR